MISEKYLAGFLDSDGSIQVMWRHLDREKKTPEIQRPHLSLEFSQEKSQDKVLYLIKDAYGGTISYREHSNSCYGTLRIFGKPAELILNRIKKYLIIKAYYAEIVLSILGQPHNRKEISSWLKEQRKVYQTPKQQYPSRKWLAGYIDGDGCFQARLAKNRFSAQPTLEICSSEYDREGLELIQKNFGGSINTNKNSICSYTLTMPPSKVNQLYDYCGEYLITKKEQLAFLKGCAKMGHYRDGKRINSFMKQLKTHPHRLNEALPNVQDLVKQVVDLNRTTKSVR